MNPRRYLYRLALLSAIVSYIVMVPSLASGQYQRSKKERGPRAIAVIRWSPDAAGKAIPKLVPVTVFIHEHYYPAGVYLANPVPMALESGTIYEARDTGEILGLFTIKNATQSPEGWFAVGSWQSRAPEMHIRAGETSTARMVTDKTQPVSGTSDSGDDRDYNHKAVTVYDEEGHPLPPSQADDATRPTDKRDTTGGIHPVESSKAPPAKPGNPDEDPDRPTIRRGGSPAAGQSAHVAAGSEPPGLTAAEADPDRPTIRRGKPGKQEESGKDAAGSPVPIRVLQRVPRIDKGGAKVFEAVAVSDASPQDEAESYRYSWSEDERGGVQEKLVRLAAAELQKFASQHPYAGLANPEARKPSRLHKAKVQKQAAPDLEVVRMEVFDLSHANDPVVYFSAETAGEGTKGYIEVVARLDINGEPRTIFRQVTTDRRLDIQPRLELVDAVDADGDGRGDLLFRSVSDRSADFAIYKVGLDSMEPLFRGGDAE